MGRARKSKTGRPAHKPKKTAATADHAAPQMVLGSTGNNVSHIPTNSIDLDDICSDVEFARWCVALTEAEGKALDSIVRCRRNQAQTKGFWFICKSPNCSEDVRVHRPITYDGSMYWQCDDCGFLAKLSQLGKKEELCMCRFGYMYYDKAGFCYTCYGYVHPLMQEYNEELRGSYGEELSLYDQQHPYTFQHSRVSHDRSTAQLRTTTQTPAGTGSHLDQEGGPASTLAGQEHAHSSLTSRVEAEDEAAMLAWWEYIGREMGHLDRETEDEFAPRLEIFMHGLYQPDLYQRPWFQNLVSQVKDIADQLCKTYPEKVFQALVNVAKVCNWQIRDELVKIVEKMIGMRKPIMSENLSFYKRFVGEVGGSLAKATDMLSPNAIALTQELGIKWVRESPEAVERAMGPDDDQLELEWIQYSTEVRRWQDRQRSIDTYLRIIYATDRDYSEEEGKEVAQDDTMPDLRRVPDIMEVFVLTLLKHFYALGDVNDRFSSIFGELEAEYLKQYRLSCADIGRCMFIEIILMDPDVEMMLSFLQSAANKNEEIRKHYCMLTHDMNQLQERLVQIRSLLEGPRSGTPATDADCEMKKIPPSMLSFGQVKGESISLSTAAPMMPSVHSESVSDGMTGNDVHLADTDAHSTSAYELMRTLEGIKASIDDGEEVMPQAWNKIVKLKHSLDDGRSQASKETLETIGNLLKEVMIKLQEKRQSAVNHMPPNLFRVGAPHGELRFALNGDADAGSAKIAQQHHPDQSLQDMGSTSDAYYHHHSHHHHHPSDTNFGCHESEPDEEDCGCIHDHHNGDDCDCYCHNDDAGHHGHHEHCNGHRHNGDMYSQEYCSDENCSCGGDHYEDSIGEDEYPCDCPECIQHVKPCKCVYCEMLGGSKSHNYAARRDRLREKLRARLHSRQFMDGGTVADVCQLGMDGVFGHGRADHCNATHELPPDTSAGATGAAPPLEDQRDVDDLLNFIEGGKKKNKKKKKKKKNPSATTTKDFGRGNTSVVDSNAVSGSQNAAALEQALCDQTQKQRLKDERLSTTNTTFKKDERNGGTFTPTVNDDGAREDIVRSNGNRCTDNDDPHNQFAAQQETLAQKFPNGLAAMLEANANTEDEFTDLDEEVERFRQLCFRAEPVGERKKVNIDVSFFRNLNKQTEQVGNGSVNF
eukprot:Clim_evm123s109 gene=Clim_evmTU123s109